MKSKNPINFFNILFNFSGGEKQKFLLVICISIIFALSACTSESEFKGKIGMTCMDLTNPFFKLIGNAMQEEAKKYGYELVALSGNVDPARQNNQLSD